MNAGPPRPRRGLASPAATLLLPGIVLAAAAMLLPPLPQPPGYHLFADRRACGWLPNCLDAGSNLLFMAVGALGLAWLWRHRRQFPGGPAAVGGDAPAWWLFFAGIAAIGFGSGYYHLDPDNAGLMLDRLAMMVAFMAFFTAVACDRMGLRAGLRLLPALLAAGIGSVLYWAWTEAAGAGDLRPYLLMQAWPMVSIVALVALHPPRHSHGGHLVAVIALYALALGFDRADQAVFEATGGLVSGHTLKHVVAAFAALLVLRYLARRRPVGHGTAADG